MVLLVIFFTPSLSKDFQGKVLLHAVHFKVPFCQLWDVLKGHRRTLLTTVKAHSSHACSPRSFCCVLVVLFCVHLSFSLSYYCSHSDIFFNLTKRAVSAVTYCWQKANVSLSKRQMWHMGLYWCLRSQGARWDFSFYTVLSHSHQQDPKYQFHDDDGGPCEGWICVTNVLQDVHVHNLS